MISVSEAPDRFAFNSSPFIFLKQNFSYTGGWSGVSISLINFDI